MMAAAGIKSFFPAEEAKEKRVATEEASPPASKRRKVLESDDEESDTEVPATQLPSEDAGSSEMVVDCSAEVEDSAEPEPPSSSMEVSSDPSMEEPLDNGDLEEAPATQEEEESATQAETAAEPASKGVKSADTAPVQAGHQNYVSAKDWAPRSKSDGPKLMWEDPKKKKQRLKKEAAARKKQEAAKKLEAAPDKGPKRPPNAYSLFVTEKRADVKAELPDATPKEVNTQLKEIWEAAADDDRQPYEEKAADLLTEYKAAKAEWDKANPQPESASKVATKRSRTKSTDAEDKGPKRPPSAYNLFSSAKRGEVKEANPDASAKDLLVLLGELWQATSEEDKAVYQDQAAAAKVEYQKAKSEWDEAHPKVEEEKAPKRPLSAYVLFSQAKREETLAANPDIKHKEVMSLLGAAWKALSAEEKEPFEKQSAELKEQYAKDKAAWDEAHPEEASAANDDSSRKRKAKDPAAPKRAMSAYMLFSSAVRSEVKEANPEATSAELMTLIAARWKELDAADKAPYEERAKAAKEQYAKEKAEYDLKNPSPKTADDSEEGDPTPTKKSRKAKRDPDEPRSPPSAYALFAAEQRETVTKANPDMAPKDVTALIKEMWGKLADEEKEKFVAENETSKKKHAEDIAAYRASKDAEETPGTSASDDKMDTDCVDTEAVEAETPAIKKTPEEPKAKKPASKPKEKSIEKAKAKKKAAPKADTKAAPKPAKAAAASPGAKTMFDFFGKGKVKSKTKSEASVAKPKGPTESDKESAAMEVDDETRADVSADDSTHMAEDSPPEAKAASAQDEQQQDEQEEKDEQEEAEEDEPDAVETASKPAASPKAKTKTMSEPPKAARLKEDVGNVADYNPAKKRYHPVDDACWEHDQDVPFRALAITLSFIEDASGRLDKISILRSFLQSVIVLTPRDLAKCIMMCSNTLAPAFMGVELGIGDSILMKVVSETTGRDMRKLREALKSEEDGDLGLIAEHSRGTQKKLMFVSAKPKLPQSVVMVFSKLTEVANIQGSSSQDKKCRLIKSMLADATPVETRFIVRFCSGKLRVGMAAGTVLPAVAHAIAYNDPLQEYPPKTIGKRPGESSDAFKERQESTHAAIKQAFCEMPDWNTLSQVLIEHPLSELADRVYIVPGTPVAPMLAKPSTGVEDILKRCDGSKFACEWKYDGERAQVHMAEDGTVAIYSRNSENNTGKYPDIVQRMPELVKEGVTSFIIDCEAVAYDAEKDTILPFQQLSTRKKKDADVDDLKGPQVCLYAFDLLYVNGESRLKETFDKRRELLRTLFVEQKGKLHFATSHVTDDSEEIAALLDLSIKENCEGLMVKQLDTTYQIAQRSHSWLKLKKDYLDGVGDTLDLTVIGAWHGKGKRSGAYGAFLLACYDPEAEEYQVITKIGTGFSDQDLTDHYKTLKEHVISAPRGYYQIADENKPEVWFDAVQVWEVKVADLSISPKYRAAAGLVDPEKGISLRFPRFERIRDDKKPEESTTSEQVAEMYLNQDVVKNARADD